MKTFHQYLQKYPISPLSEKLIVGTIHPHDHDKFLMPFFYGSKLSLWKILKKAYPEQLTSELKLETVLKFLNERKISVSDTVKVCTRKNPTALDKDLIPAELNFKIIDDISNSQIKEVLFTSGFATNNAFRLFYCNILGNKITKEIRDSREIILDQRVFGRPVKLTVLYSPSGSSNVGLSKSRVYKENANKYVGRKKPVHDFKVDYYREKFQ